MTTNTSELITKIRTWEAADAAYTEARKQHKEANTTASYQEEESKEEALVEATASVTGKRFHAGYPRVVLAAFVALADHCERLEAERDAMKKHIDDALSIGKYSVSAFYDGSPGNDMRDEFRRALLTGDDSASK